MRALATDLSIISKYYSLMVNLLKRDLHIKYRSSIMGYCWSMANPLAMIATYILAFKYIMRIRDTGGYNISVQIILGITFWNLFSSQLISSTNALLADADLIKKISFPRIISVIRSYLFLLSEHFLIYPFLLIALYLWYHTPLTWNILYFFPIFILYNICIFGICLFLATVTVFYRDIAHFAGLGLQMLFWLTPVVYPIAMVPQKYHWLYTKPPATPFIISFYDIFLSGCTPSGSNFIYMIAYAIGSLAIGLLVFYRYQRRFCEEF